MTFSEILTESTEEKQEVKVQPKKVQKSVDASVVIRDMGLKIKLVLPTSFGTEYVLAKKYEPEILERLAKLLSPRKIKIKGNSVFVM